MTPEKLQEILIKHKLWLDGDPAGERANLSDADLSRADLSRANLSRANLSDADLSRANLSRANLSRANLSRADLSRANLSRADLSRANLSRANLSRADLSRANLSRANLSDANLSDANLSRANLSDADLSRADLSRANLSKTEGLLSTINFLEAHFERTDEGYIAYKTFNQCYASPEEWDIAPGSVISENVQFDRCAECGCGVNVAPLDWVRSNHPGEIWKVLIRWEWLCGVCVPYHSDGKIRCERVELIETVN